MQQSVVSGYVYVFFLVKPQKLPNDIFVSEWIRLFMKTWDDYQRKKEVLIIHTVENEK